jgi:hypothetical protein
MLRLEVLKNVLMNMKNRIRFRPEAGKMEIKQNRDYASPLPDEKELDLKIDS